MPIYATDLTPIELASAIVRNPLVVSHDTTVMEAIAQMSGLRACCNTTETADAQLEQLHRDARSSCVVVLENGQVAGILTERDVIRLSAQRQPLNRLPVHQVMARAIVTLPEASFTNLLSAIHLLHQHHIRHLPILDDQGHLVGLVTHETLRYISRPIDLLRLRRVVEVMTPTVVWAASDASLLAIAQRMAAKDVSSVVLLETREPAAMDGGGEVGEATPGWAKPIGIITERDLVQFQALGLDLEQWTAAAVMSTPVFTMQPEDSLWEVQQLMAQRLIRRVVVTGAQGELLGIVTQSSLLQALNPLEIYRLAEVLESRVTQLEAEKMALLESRTLELERQVEARTAALQAKMEREALLMSLADQIRSSLDLQDILNHAVTQVRSLLQCDRVIIYQLSDYAQGVVVAEAIGAGKSLLHQTLQDPCLPPRWLEPYRTGKIRVVPDVLTAPLAPCHRELLLALDIRAKVMVPIVMQGQVWGLMVASHRDAPYAWQPDELDLLKQLSVPIALAIQQATTYAQATRELEERRRAEDAARHIAAERQQALDSLRESEQRYATLAASAPVGIFRTDAEGRCIYVNQRCCEIGGHLWEEALDFAWHQFLHPDDRQTVVANFERAIQENRPFQGEYRFLHRDGTVRWVLGQAVAERDASGQVTGYVGTLTDISDRKQAELALQQSEAQSQAVLSAIPDLMIHLGVDGTVRGYSTQHRELDIVPATINPVGQKIDDLVPAAISQRLHHHIRQAMQTGALQVYEQQTQVGDRLQEEEVRLIKSGDDEVLLMIRDITERKQAEAALRQSERRNRIIVETMPDLLIQMDRDGNYSRILGGSAVQVKQLPDEPSAEPDIFTVLPRDLAEQRLHHTRLALDSGSLQVYEQALEIDGNQVYEEVRIAPLTDREVLIIIRDVTERRQAEAERLQAVKVRQELILLEQILDLVLAGYWDWDIVNHEEYLSPGFKRMLGYTDEELANLPESWQNLIFPEDLPATWSQLDHHIQSRGTVPFYNEARYRHKDGSTVWVICSGQVIEWDAEGNPLRMVGCHIDISERKRTELERQRLIQELSDFKFALDQSAIVAMTNAQGMITYVNDRFCEISGYSRAELLGQTHHIINASHHGTNFFQDLWRTLAQGEVWRGEICNRTKDGQMYWVDSTLVPFLDDAGKPFQYLAIRFDITARKLAEQALQESQQFIKTVIDTVPLPLVWKDRHSVFLGCNRQLADLFGLKTTAEIVGKTDFDLTQNQAEAIAYQANDQWVMQSEQPKLRIEETITLPTGEQRWIETHKTPLRDWAGDVVGVVAMFQDITERKHSELALRTKTEELDQFFSLALDLLCIANTSGYFIRLSSQWEKTLGYSIADLEGQRFLDFVHPDDLEITLEAIAQMEQTGEIENFVNRYRCRDGSYRWLEWRSVPNGSLIYATARDVTLRKQAEVHLQRTNEELARAARLKDEFLANMSHELRTPLNAILGMTEGLQEGIFGDLGPRPLKALQTIERSGSHLLELINDILDIAKIESGQMELDRVPTAVIPLCQNSLAFITQQALKKQIRLELKLPSHPPNLHVDERRIRQVLINLLNNAVKFTPAGGHVTLEVSHPAQPDEATEAGSPLRIAITDTGIGIAPEAIPRLFQPFVQVDSALNRKYEGTGLGLALVKRIVELHGGQVGVTSRVGVGSCFTLDLPTIPDTVPIPASDPPPKTLTLPAAQAPAANPLILLAEDNPANISTLSSYLTARGYRLLLAQNGREAIALTQANHPDLILMDVQMPEMDGLTAIQHIRANPQLAHIPIIALTALAMAGDRDRCLAMGADDYLAKPVKLKQLVTTIHQLLSPPQAELKTANPGV